MPVEMIGSDVEDGGGPGMKSLDETELKTGCFDDHDRRRIERYVGKCRADVSGGGGGDPGSNEHVRGNCRHHVGHRGLAVGAGDGAVRDFELPSCELHFTDKWNACRQDVGNRAYVLGESGTGDDILDTGEHCSVPFTPKNLDLIINADEGIRIAIVYGHIVIEPPGKACRGLSTHCGPENEHVHGRTPPLVARRKSP